MGTYSWLCVSTLRIAFDVPPGDQKYGSRYDGFERPLGDESTPLRNRQLFLGTGITAADTLDLSRFVSVERREELIGLGYNLELFVTTFGTRVTVAIAANDGAPFPSRMDQIVDDNGVPVAGLAGAACLVGYIYTVCLLCTVCLPSFSWTLSFCGDSFRVLRTPCITFV